MWELSKAAHYTSSHVMCWVALDRTLAVGRRLGMPDREDWARAANAIRSDVLTRGWNAARGAFTQMPGSEALDASALLIPLYGLLPIDDARVVSTVERIADELTIDGFLYRFDPAPLGGVMGEFEAAFIPCTFWLAAVYRLLNRDGDAGAVLSAVDSIGGEARLLAEAVDPRTRSFAGNFPLAFSHAERIRAALA
jgi:GH15 family glucan-1,4-alpha-glucosidase